MNPGRLTSTLILRSRSCTPSTNCGNGSETIVSAAVVGFTAIDALTTTVPRLNGPATAGTTMLNPNGAPLYGPVR